MPALAKIGANVGPIITSAGLSGAIAGERFGIEMAGTDIDAVLADDSIAAAIVATQHNSHASIAAKLLGAGKDVFVEKPLAITAEQLAEVRAAYDGQVAAGKAPRLMLGYNRRFAPHVVKMKALLDKVIAPKSFIMTMNAGAIPADVWIQDPSVGGGRIIGEACHLIDLMRFLAGHPIVEIKAQKMGTNSAEFGHRRQSDHIAALCRWFTWRGALSRQWFGQLPQRTDRGFRGGSCAANRQFQKLARFWLARLYQNGWMETGQGQCPLHRSVLQRYPGRRT